MPSVIKKETAGKLDLNGQKLSPASFFCIYFADACFAASSSTRRTASSDGLEITAAAMISQGGFPFTLSTAAVTAATSPLKNTVV